jgi:RHS repeat-associated protein
MRKPNQKSSPCSLFVVLALFCIVSFNAFSQGSPECPQTATSIAKKDKALKEQSATEIQLTSRDNSSSTWEMQQSVDQRKFDVQSAHDPIAYVLPPPGDCDPGGGGCEPPIFFTVTGGGYICSDASYVDPIYQDGSEIGVTYKLWRYLNGSWTLLTTKSGTNSAISWGYYSQPASYEVRATRTVCSNEVFTIGHISVTNRNPLQYPLSGGGTYCGTPLTITLTDSEDGAHYELYRGSLPTGLVMEGTGTAITWTNITVAGNYQAYGYRFPCNPGDIVPVSTTTVDVVAVLAPTLDVQDAKYLCNGQSQTLTITNYDANVFYSWRKNGVPLVTGFSPGITIAPSSMTVSQDAVEGSFDVEVSNGSCKRYSNAVIIKFFPAPPATISYEGKTNPCQGDIVTLKAPPGDYTYEWTNASNQVVGTAIEYSPTVTGSYKVKVTWSQVNCSSTSSPYNVNFEAIPPASITPNPEAVTSNPQLAAVCTGTITLTANGGYQYEWKIDGDNILGVTTQGITADRTGVYSVIVKSANCSNVATKNVLIVNLKPQLVAEGLTSICTGTSIRINAFFEEGYTYQWKKDGGNILGSEATNSYYPASQAGIYTVQLSRYISEKSEWCTKLSDPISVTTKPSPTSSISNPTPTKICDGSQVVLNGSTGTSYTYQWQKDAVTIPLETNPTYTASSEGFYTLVTTLGDCSTASSPVQVQVMPKPVFDVVASGTTTLCTGDNVKLSAISQMSGVTYQWIKLPSEIKATGTEFLASEAGSFIARGSLDICTVDSQPISVIVNPRPGNVTTVAGPLTLAVGEKQIYSVADDVNVDVFVWNIAAGTSIIYQNTKQFSAQLGFNQSGFKTISVSAKKNGCLSPAPTFKVIEVTESSTTLPSQIPAEVKASPLRPNGLPITGTPIPITDLAVNQIRDVFSGCDNGEYYLGFQLYYDALADRNTSVNWIVTLDIMLMNGTTNVWTLAKQVSVDMPSQTFRSTIFHDSPISCGTPYKYKIIAKVTNANGVQAPEQNIYLLPLLHRRFTDTFVDPPTLPITHSIAGGVITWNWNTVTAAKGFDFEWVYIDDREGFTGTTALAAFQFKEGVRISTTATTYKQQLHYPTGKIWYRVRPVGYNVQYPKHQILGTWRYGPDAGVVWTNHSQLKNWMSQTVFAEDGAYKKVMTYYDGSLRQRQTQTNLSSDNQTMVGEMYYDFEGRKSADVLPAPSSDVSMAYKTNFNSFQSVHSTVTSNTSSTQKKFHYDNLGLTNSIMATTTGASQYYSSANISTSVHKDYIPNAEGYVYSQVEYINDGTGRPVRQSGLGPAFAMEGKQVTKYYYGEATRTELVRLFGTTNVGQPSHYKKNVVIDANGQASVSYIDQSGKVIATALAGDIRKDDISLTTPLTDPLQSYLDLPTANSIVDISSKNAKSEGIAKIVHRIFNEAVNTDYTFNYDLSSIGSTIPSFGCQSCIYEFSITVSDPDGKLMDLPAIAGDESADLKLYKRSNLTAANCSSTTALSSIQFLLQFTGIGDYTITKQLNVQERTFEEMKTVVESSTTVLNTITEISNRYTVDPLDCEFCYTETPPCSDADAAINEAIEEIADMDCENILQEIINRLKASLSPDVDPTQAAIEADAQYCNYQRCIEDKEADVFDKQMARVTYWQIAKEAPYDYDLLASPGTNSPDPFFNKEELNGYNYSFQMSILLSSIKIAVIDGKEIKGSILAITDPTNQAFYFTGTDQNGNKTGPHHILYYNLQSDASLTNLSTLIDKQRWTLFRNFYLEAKRKLKLNTVSAYTSCPKAKERLAQSDNLPLNFTTNTDAANNSTNVTNWGKSMGSTDPFLVNKGIDVPVSQAELEMHIAMLELQCGNVKFSAAHVTDIKNYLSAYFTSKGNVSNFLRVIVQADIASNSNLIAINSILSGYGCSLQSTYVDPIVCVKSGSIPPSYGSNRIQNPTLTPGGSCSGNEQLKYMTSSGTTSSTCFAGWRPANGTPLLKVDGPNSFQLEGTNCSQDAIVNTLTTALTVNQKYVLRFKYKYPYGTPGQNRVVLSRSPVYYVPTPVGGGGGDPCNPACLQLAKQNDAPRRSKFATNQELAEGKLSPTIAVADPGTSCPLGRPDSEDLIQIPQGGFYTEVFLPWTPGTTDANGYYSYEFIFIAKAASTYMYFLNNASFSNDVTGMIYKDVELRPLVPGMSNICLKYDSLNGTLAEWRYIPDWGAKIQACKDSAAKEKNYLINFAAELYKEDQASIYYNAYKTNCLANATEQLKYTYKPKEYHYTLYYYDQAGNLVQTVPPKGVDVRTYAEGNSGALTPNHTLVTQYQYTSLNQIRKQITPDAGLSEFFYDKKGRLRLSRNAQQTINNKYSYTKYDLQGRIVEVGEMTAAVPPETLQPHLDNLQFPTTGVSGLPTYPLNDVTKTFYDTENESILSQLVQQNLRARVSYVEVTDNTGPDKTVTHYSYDVHGNVKALVQQIPGLDFKRTDYVYDLISGKVTYAFYQYNKADQFTHRYKYDSDNRLRFVASSSDAYIWNNEAEYKYYAHGPLARVVLSEYAVQGMDYYYTLQGWVKGVNMPYAGDPKADGTGISTVGKDVFAYTLGYYQNDYKPSLATAVMADTRDLVWTRLRELTGTSGLYNGNISWMITDLTKIGDVQGATKRMQAMVYRYDQLNRIKKSYGLTTYVDGSGFSTRSTSPAGYDETFTYDGNGNILQLKRYNATGAITDDFNYQYYNGTNKLRMVKPLATGTLNITSGAVTSPGKIYQVINVSGSAYVASGSTVELIAAENINMSPDFVVQNGADFTARGLRDNEGNYVYDAIGNLIFDQDADAKITWTPYGKVRTVKTKGDTETVSYLYDGSGNRVAKRVIKPGSSTVTHYVRDASGNVMAVYANTEVTEHHIYGSSRLGMYKEGVVEGRVTLGKRNYELGNHLGNVLVVITDNVTLTSTTASATVVKATDYYAFGHEMPVRTFTSGTYRYGFNGKEKEGDEFGVTAYDYGMRIYSPQLGRFFSTDPIATEYPMLAPYQFAGNTPIWAVDLDGLEPLVASDFKTLDQLKKNLKLEYCYDLVDDEKVYQVTVSQSFWGINHSNVLLENGGPKQSELRTFAGMVKYSANHPGNALVLNKVRNMSYKAENDQKHSFQDIATALKGNLKNTVRDGSTVDNTFLHVAGQSFITVLFGEGYADVAGDAHERDHKALMTGDMTGQKMNLVIDNYADMINNEWGQRWGAAIAKDLGITKDTEWTDALTSKYMNALQDKITKGMGLKFKQTFKESDDFVKKTTEFINANK